MVDVSGDCRTLGAGVLKCPPPHTNPPLVGNFTNSQRQLLRKISPMMHGKTNRRQSHGQQKTSESCI